MATPKLKVGDTFVYTEEMSKVRDHQHVPSMDDLIGQKLEVTAVSSNRYGAAGWDFPIVGIDSCLPPKPRTLDDVKEGDVLIEQTGDRRLVLGRTGRMVYMSYTEKEPKMSQWNTYTIAYLVSMNFKFADQTVERWKPEEGEQYYWVRTNMKGEIFVDSASWEGCPFDEGVWTTGNCFKTEEEAEKAASELKEFWRNRGKK